MNFPIRVSFLCLLWFASLTFALPLTLAILFSLSFRRRYFAWAYSNVVELFIRVPFEVPRKRAFRMLREELDPGSEPLEVLEIGVGPGLNLKFYPENFHLTALDKNENLKPYFLKNLGRFSNVPFRGFLVRNAENMEGIEDSSFDVVISTYLHCSTHDSDAVLKEIKRVLKPGGKYVFVDHVGFPKGGIAHYLQRLANPLWNLHGNGCNLQRDTEKKIKEAGFTRVICHRIDLEELLVYFVSHQIVGIAIK